MGSELHEQLDELRSSLEEIAEHLGELVIKSLREAVAQGIRERPLIERKLTQARRAVEKAAWILGEVHKPDE
ncbi:MAG: hypothetical protein M1483_00900 [Actinobacteria bacterium]|nr:hypothetical protein [Actinomycetota bacterium]MCL6104193.1 hypothetical protein [Actinomycetota bacterium]